VGSLARELGLSQAVVYRELRAGRIPSIRCGRRFILPRSAIRAWLETAGKSLQPAASTGIAAGSPGELAARLEGGVA